MLSALARAFVIPVMMVGVTVLHLFQLAGLRPHPAVGVPLCFLAGVIGWVCIVLVAMWCWNHISISIV